MFICVCSMFLKIEGVCVCVCVCVGHVCAGIQALRHPQLVSSFFGKEAPTLFSGRTYKLRIELKHQEAPQTGSSSLGYSTPKTP